MLPLNKKRKVDIDVFRDSECSTDSLVEQVHLHTDYTDAQLNDAKLLVAVHCSDLKVGSQSRDWDWIAGAAGLRCEDETNFKRFNELKVSTSMWFPYPPIPLNSFEPANMERKAHVSSSCNEPTDFEYYSTYGDKPWNYSVDLLRRSALIVKPWAMRTWQVEHYLGYFDAPEENESSLDVFEDRFEEAVMLLPKDVLKNYQDYKAGEEADKEEQEILKELETLMEKMQDAMKWLTSNITMSQAVSDIRDVAYYRRNLYSSNGTYERQIMSDYEMVKLYLTGAQICFDFESYETEYWEEFLASCGVVNMPVVEARQDFFKYCVPRMNWLRRFLAKDKPDVYVNLQSDPAAVCTVLYHFTQDYSFYGILRSIELLQKRKVINLDLIGGIGVHHAAFIFVMLILQYDAADFLTCPLAFARTRLQIVYDVLQNYTRFHSMNTKFS